MSYLVSFCVFFSPFSIAITSLGEERANLSAFRTFVRFVLVWICRFPLPLGVSAVCDCGTPWTFLLTFLFFMTYERYSEIHDNQISLLMSSIVSTIRIFENITLELN